LIKNMERRTFLEAAIAIMPLAALGQSSTPQTSAQTAKIEALIEQRKLRRKVHGIAATLLPFAAERDRLWEAGDPAYYALSDALQYLGNVAFREPVPAYKHSAAVFLHLTGQIPTDLTHPKYPRKPTVER
jgi:hypothetical protein